MQPMPSWPKCPPHWITRTRVRVRTSVRAALASALLAPAAWLPMPAAGAEDGARLAGTCTGCHGTNGNTVGDALPALAGQSRDALLASLAAFKSGQRDATVMTQIAKGYSDEQLARIAAFFSAQQPPAAAGASATTGSRARPGAGS
jgi:cytochrome subunit of sulfide dehydrogenase